MFLDDINRKITKQRGKGEYWDKYDYLDLEWEEVDYPLIDKIRLLYFKNIGKEAVRFDVGGMKSKLFPKEEKYLPISGDKTRQVIFYVHKPGGKLFIGQSKRENTRIPNGFLIFVLALLFNLSLSGCAHQEEGFHYKGPTPTPGSPKAARLVSTPKIPKTAKLPSTPDSPSLSY